MEMKVIIEFFMLITGIGAASGIHFNDNNNALYLISDDSNYFYEYCLNTDSLNRHLLYNMEGNNEQVYKKSKLDLEAMTYNEGIYYLFSSGSKANRNKLFEVDTDFSIKTNDIDIHAHLRGLLNISQKDYNIEGAIMIDENTFLLFNRGNGPEKRNGIIIVKNLEARFIPIALPAINEHSTGFTDAVLLNDKIYFLAAAEGGDSSYDDGKIGGTIIGTINPADWSLGQTEILSYERKFEGITLYKTTENQYTFLLCEDPDDGSNESAIYRLEVPR